MLDMLRAVRRTFRLISLSSTKRSPVSSLAGAARSVCGDVGIARVVVEVEESIEGDKEAGIEEAEGTSEPGASSSGCGEDGGDWCHLFKVRSSILASFRTPGLCSICFLLATKRARGAQ